MASKREGVLTGVTPKGIAVYPKLTEPDTKFDEAGVYGTKLTLSAEAAAPLIAQLEELRESFRGKAKELAKGKKVKDADLPYTENEEEGTVTFGFKMKASGVSKKTGKPWTMKPALFDAKGKPLTDAPKVGGGSTLKVSYEASAFWTALVGLGVSLRLQAVQILDLKEWGDRSADSYGFGEEEGYAAEDVEEKSPFGDEEDLAPVKAPGSTEDDF